MEIISRTEENLLLAVINLKDEAYGLAIRKWISRLLGKDISVGAIYIPLDRLVKKGFLSTREGEPSEKRGGRRKRFYRVTADGAEALNAAKQIHDAAWQGLLDAEFKNA